MKENFLLLIAFFICRFLMAQALFSGVLEHYGSNQVSFWTASDYELPLRYDTIYLTDQTFTIEVKTDQTVLANVDFFLNLGTRKIFTVPVFLNPEDTIKIYLDFSKRDDKNEWIDCRFEGRNAKGHELFYEYYFYPLSMHLEPFYSILDKEESGVQFDKFKAEIDSIISPFRQLLSDGKIDDRYFTLATDYIKTDIVNSLVAGFYVQGNDWFLFRKKSKVKAETFINSLLQYLPPSGEVSLLTRPRANYLITCLTREEVIKRDVETFADLPDTLVAVNGIEYNLSRYFAPILNSKNELLKEYLFAYQLDEYYRIFLMPEMADSLNEVLDFFW